MGCIRELGRTRQLAYFGRELIAPTGASIVFAVNIGRPARAKNLLKKSTVAVAVAAGLTMAIPATPAAAASTVDCGSPVINEYTRVSSNYYPWPTCFANAGAVNVSIYDTQYFHSGNNKVTFYYTVEENNFQNSFTLDKWQETGLAFGFHAHVTVVVIW